MDIKKVNNALATLLADTYVLMLKTQNVHWNITGLPFYAVHNLTEEQYNDLFAAVDEIAERMRALGTPAPGTMADFLKITTLKEGSGGKDFNEMIVELANTNQTMADQIRAAIQTLDEPGTEDLFTIRLQAHEKAAWMWRSVHQQFAGASQVVPTSNGQSKSAPKTQAQTNKKPPHKPAPTAKAKPASKPKAKAAKKKKGRVTRNVSDIG